MKKVFKIILIILLLFIIAYIVIYASNYKSFDQTVDLLAKGTEIDNLYAERYIDYGEYINNLKNYMVEIYLKDNVLIYNVLGRIEYANFNTNESYVIENNQKGELNIETWTKFNDYSSYFNLNNCDYHYVFPGYTNGTLCDIVKLKDKNYNINYTFYIAKDTGLVMKKISSGKNKNIESYKYSIDSVTDEQIKNFE